MRLKFGKFVDQLGAIPAAKESEIRLKSDLGAIDMSVFDPAQVEDIQRIVGKNYLIYLEFVAFKKSFGDTGVATLLALEPLYRGSKGVLLDLALIKGYMEIMRRNSVDFSIDIMPILYKLVISYKNWTLQDLDKLFKKVIYAVNSVYLVRMQKEFVEKDWDDYGEFVLFWSNIEFLMKEYSRRDGFDYLKQVLRTGLN